MKTFCTILFLLCSQVSWAQLRFGTSISAGVNRIIHDDWFVASGRRMPWQFATEAEFWLDYFVVPSLGVRASYTANIQLTRERFGFEARALLGGDILSRSWGLGLIHQFRLTNFPNIAVESYVQAGIRSSEGRPFACGGTSSSVSSSRDADSIAFVRTSYVYKEEASTVPEMKAGIGVSFPFSSYPFPIRMVLSTEFRYSFREVARSEGVFAEDVYPLDPLRDFGEQADEFRAFYPECWNISMEELTNQVEFTDSWVNRFPGHILQFRVGFIFPIGSKKD